MCAPPPPAENTAATHLPLVLPPEFLDWLREIHGLTPRQLDLLRCRAHLMVPKEIAVALGLQLSSVRRLQALTLDRLRITGGEKGLLLWLADAYARWQAEENRGAA